MSRHFKTLPSKGRVESDAATPVCGCGLSRTFPLCDSSQMISKTREPGKLVSCGSAEAVAPSHTQVRAVET
jgi:hypothetical protein